MNQTGYMRYQRVRVEKLHQWKGERVTLVGKLSTSGSDAQLTLDLNNPESTIILSNFDTSDSSYSDNSYVEVRGMLNGERAMSVEDHNDFGGETFNLDNYNSMVALMDFNVYA
jgi:hypothetical protein